MNGVNLISDANILIFFWRVTTSWTYLTYLNIQSFTDVELINPVKCIHTLLEQILQKSIYWVFN